MPDGSDLPSPMGDRHRRAGDTSSLVLSCTRPSAPDTRGACARLGGLVLAGRGAFEGGEAAAPLDPWDPCVSVRVP